MKTYPYIDVKQLLAELKTRTDITGKKITDRKIADEVATTEATISRLRRGVIKFSRCERAIANFHAQIFSKK